MNKYKIILFFLLLISISCKGQDFEKVVLDSSDTSNLYINDGESTELYYLKLVPKGKIKATLVTPQLIYDVLNDHIKECLLSEVCEKAKLGTRL